MPKVKRYSTSYSKGIDAHTWCLQYWKHKTTLILPRSIFIVATFSQDKLIINTLLLKVDSDFLYLQSPTLFWLRIWWICHWRWKIWSTTLSIFSLTIKPLLLKVAGTGEAYFKLNRVSIFRLSLIGWKTFSSNFCKSKEIDKLQRFYRLFLHHYLYQWPKYHRWFHQLKMSTLPGFTLIPLYRQSSKYLRRYNTKKHRYNEL